MNKTGFIKELSKQTKLSENECVLIDECIEENFIIGKNNKQRTIDLMIEKLNYDEAKANEIYNIASSIITTQIKEKIKHPFRSKD